MEKNNNSVNPYMYILYRDSPAPDASPHSSVSIYLCICLFIYFKPFENKYNDTSSKNKDIVQCRCQKNHQRIDNAILILSSRPHLPTESCPAVSAAAAAVRSFTLQPRTRPEAPRRLPVLWHP